MSNSFATPWTIDSQAPLCMEFSRQEYWRELPLPSPGDLLNLDPACTACVSFIGRWILYHWAKLYLNYTSFPINILLYSRILSRIPHDICEFSSPPIYNSCSVFFLSLMILCFWSELHTIQLFCWMSLSLSGVFVAGVRLDIWAGIPPFKKRMLCPPCILSKDYDVRGSCYWRYLPPHPWNKPLGSLVPCIREWCSETKI